MACSFHNAEDPNAPEYQKAFKPENNFGCQCTCNSSTTEQQAEADTEDTVIRLRLTREDFI
jgi:hypothetical protein